MLDLSFSLPFSVFLPILLSRHSQQHLPLVVTLVALILAVFKVISFTHSFLAACGTVSAWSYLRFYQRRDEGVKGDMAEGFEFATLFPEFLQ